MKELNIITIIVLCLTIVSFTQEIPFEKFDKNRIDTGTLYTYELSTNKEEFEPNSKVYFYVKTLTDIEKMGVTLKDTKAAGIEVYKMNWNYMMLENMEFIPSVNKNDISIGATFKFNIRNDFSKRIMRYIGTNRDKEGFKENSYTWKFKEIPTYFYRITDLMPLWFALRFFPLHKEIIHVNHNSQGTDTELDIKYEGLEEVNTPYGKVKCHKFELINEISFWMKLFYTPKKAWIWLTSEDEIRYMVKYKNNNQKNTFAQSMEYRLLDRKKITLKEWEQFKQKLGAEQKETTNSN